MQTNWIYCLSELSTDFVIQEKIHKTSGVDLDLSGQDLVEFLDRMSLPNLCHKPHRRLWRTRILLCLRALNAFA